MGTKLIIGVVLTVLAVITVAICYLAARNPKQPGWASDTIIGSVILPLVVGAVFAGPMFVAESLAHLEALTFNDMAVALSIFVAGVAILLVMRIPRRLAKYEALGSAVEMQKQREAGLRAGGAEAQFGR